jgi:hypothetical protein
MAIFNDEHFIKQNANRGSGGFGSGKTGSTGCLRIVTHLFSRVRSLLSPLCMPSASRNCFGTLTPNNPKKRITLLSPALHGFVYSTLNTYCGRLMDCDMVIDKRYLCEFAIESEPQAPLGIVIAPRRAGRRSPTGSGLVRQAISFLAFAVWVL